MATFFFIFLAGMALGGFYFAGLWLTVTFVLGRPKLAPLVILSFSLRTGFTVLGFYLLMGTSWLRVVVALLGFLLARVLLSQQLVQVQKRTSSLGASYET
ncbi:MAG: ATP synthase subunit I [Trueperaceae bacterium]|nr:ATP synthase subunit I [Trueperaceae bacterium]